MSKTIRYSKEAAERICAFLSEEKIKFTFNERRGTIRFVLPVRGAGEGLLRFYVFLNEDSSYEIRALSPQKPDEFDDFVISNLYEFFCRVNQDLRQGCMYMNDDYEIWYKLYQEYRPDELSRQSFMDTVRGIVTDCECYSYGIFRLMNHDLNPKIAITASDNTRKQLESSGIIVSKDALEELDKMFDELLASFKEDKKYSAKERQAEIRVEEKDDRTICLFDEVVQELEEESKTAKEEAPACLNLVHAPCGDDAGLRVIFANRYHFNAFLNMCKTVQQDDEQDIKADWHISRFLEIMKNRYEELPAGESDCKDLCCSVFIPAAELDKVYLAMEQAFRLYHVLYKKYEKRKKTMHKMGKTIKDLNDYIDKIT